MVKKALKTRDKTITVRVTGEEFDQFSQLSDSYGLKKSDAMRRAALAALGKGPVLPMKNQQEFLMITEELRAIGVNLNQAVRAMNTGRVPDDESMRLDMADLTGGIEAIAEVLVVMAASARKTTRKALESEALYVQSV